MTTPTGDALKASAAQVRVKPLEWRALDVTNREAAVANSILGKWEVWHFPGGGTYVMKPGEDQGTVYEDGYEEAKAYLERVYQRRIAPALSPVEQAPQPVAAKRVGHRELDLVEQSGDILVKYGLAPHAWDEAGREALEAAASEIIVLARLPSAPTPTEAPPVESQAAEVPVAWLYTSKTAGDSIVDWRPIDQMALRRDDWKWEPLYRGRTAKESGNAD